MSATNDQSIPGLSLRGYDSFFTINRIKIIENIYLTKDHFVPCRSKKKRIIKKWAKNPDHYKTIPDITMYKTPFGIVCHPEVAAMLQIKSRSSATEIDRK